MLSSFFALACPTRVQRTLASSAVRTFESRVLSFAGRARRRGDAVLGGMQRAVELKYAAAMSHTLSTVSSTMTSRRSRTGALLTVEEAAERLNVSVRNIRHQIFQRRIPVVKIGRLVRIEEVELEAFIDRGRVPRE
jgi:excisionase family DNA binding protein